MVQKQIPGPKRVGSHTLRIQRCAETSEEASCHRDVSVLCLKLPCTRGTRSCPRRAPAWRAAGSAACCVASGEGAAQGCPQAQPASVTTVALVRSGLCNHAPARGRAVTCSTLRPRGDVEGLPKHRISTIICFSVNYPKQINICNKCRAVS